MSMDNNWDTLRLFCINRWPENLGAIHGMDHWDRVARFGQMLRQEEADMDVVTAFAYLHDSERENNAEDPDHGLRASKLIDAIRTSELKVLNDEQIEKLKRACELHTIQQSTGDPTIDICFDADRMDLLRVGIMPLPERMATKQGAEMVGNPQYKELYYKFCENNNYSVVGLERKLEVKIQDNIPESPYSNAAKALGNGLISGDFDGFESLLSENVENIVYSKETHKGKSATIDYWKGWRNRYVETNKAKSFEVVFSNYYSNACLLMEMMVVMFLIKDRKIAKILMMQRHLNPTICHHDDILDFTFDLKSLERCLSDLRESNEIFEPVIKENRIPCLTCGKPSEELEWHSSLIQAGIHGYSSIVSVCPHCHKVVEYYPEMRTRYIEPVDPKEAKYPIPHRPKKKDYNPKLYGIRNFEGGEPLKGTKYVEGLSGEMRQAAEESNWFLLSTMGHQDFEKVRECFLSAINEGVFEAANNLGVFVYNFESKADEGKMLLRKAIDGGSHYAMLNLFTILWTEEKYEEAGNLLEEVYTNPSPSLKCLWNKAFFHFMGDDYAHNPIKKKNTDIAKMILNTILDQEGNSAYNEEKEVFKAAKDFLAYIDEGNIFASKAKDYHWRIKVNLDSLKKKGDDAVFYDLDALSLENGYHMGLRTAEQSGMGDESSFYVYDKNNQVDRDILKYIHVDETPMGAWQVYLLMTSPTQLPTYWHGGYIKRTFILEGDELYDIKALKNYDLSDLVKQKMLYPEVVFEMNTDIKTAHIYCCYWNEWKGLVREHVEMQIHNGKVISYEKKSEFVIYKYHCGIYF